MRTTELLCVFCLFLASAANKCDGDSSCIAEEDDASLLQSASNVKESSLTGRAGDYPDPEEGEDGKGDGKIPDPDPELAESEAQESSVTDRAGDEEEGDDEPLVGEGPPGAGEGGEEGEVGEGEWPAGGAAIGADSADGTGGEVEDPQEFWDPSACSKELCEVCEACFQQIYNGTSPHSNFAGECLGGAGLGQGEVCGIEDQCVGQGAQGMMKCVAEATNADVVQGQGITITQIGNCMAEKMCDAGTAKICAVGTTVATNWHSMTCPTSPSLLEKKRSKQNKSVGQEISLDDSLSGKRTC